MSTTEQSKISWTHYTFNPWRGCTKISPGCANCYAEKLSGRNPKALGVWGPDGERVIAAESYWNYPLKWAKEAHQAGERRRVFCASLADVFEWKDTMPAEAWPAVRAARVRLLAMIDRTAEHLDWLLLTKRPERFYAVLEDIYQETDWDQHEGKNDIHDMVRDWRMGIAPTNVWLGTSVEDQKRADERIPQLIQCPAAIRFLSCEPLLGLIDLSQSSNAPTQIIPGVYAPVLRQVINGIHWVIVGGESGANARQMHPDWARSIRDQCVAAGVAFHFKQWGEWAPCRIARIEDNDHYRELDHMTAVHRVGKKVAGRELDGRTWDEFPKAGT